MIYIMNGRIQKGKGKEYPSKSERVKIEGEDGDEDEDAGLACGFQGLARDDAWLQVRTGRVKRLVHSTWKDVWICRFPNALGQEKKGKRKKDRRIMTERVSNRREGDWVSVSEALHFLCAPKTAFFTLNS